MEQLHIYQVSAMQPGAATRYAFADVLDDSADGALEQAKARIEHNDQTMWLVAKSN